MPGGADDPFAKCQAICSELAIEVQKNVLEVPSSSERSGESSTKSTVIPIELHVSVFFLSNVVFSEFFFFSAGDNPQWDCYS
jgi:hypothetical protein